MVIGGAEPRDRLIAEWLAAGRAAKSPTTTSTTFAPPTVAQLLLAFWDHAKKRYVKNGRPTSEQRSFKVALRPVRQLYGSEPVTAFGPLALTACKGKLIEAGICRKRINQHLSRIRLVFKWGVARELVPEAWRARARHDRAARCGDRAAAARPARGMTPFTQEEFACRCEWGPDAVAALAPANVIIVVDVFSFTTCVDVAVSRGVAILPYGWNDPSAADFARIQGAELAGKRRKTRYSLAPESYLDAPAGLRCVLPSPNGARVTLSAAPSGAAADA